MVPSRVLLTMASSEELTMAARRRTAFSSSASRGFNTIGSSDGLFSVTIAFAVYDRGSAGHGIARRKKILASVEPCEHGQVSQDVSGKTRDNRVVRQLGSWWHRYSYLCLFLHRKECLCQQAFFPASRPCRGYTGCTSS